LEVPHQYGSEPRRYLPDFVVLLDDGHALSDPLHLVVEIKGYRAEDAKEKKTTIETYWIPAVNTLGTFGRWAFAEFREIYQIQDQFHAVIEEMFDGFIEAAVRVNDEDAIDAREAASRDWLRYRLGRGERWERVNHALWEVVAS